MIDNHDMNELHELIQEYCLKKGFRPAEVLAFLSLSFVGTVEMHGYSEEFFDATCEKMKLTFRNKRNKRIDR